MAAATAVVDKVVAAAKLIHGTAQPGLGQRGIVGIHRRLLRSLVAAARACPAPAGLASPPPGSRQRESRARGSPRFHWVSGTIGWPGGGMPVMDCRRPARCAGGAP